MYDAKINMDLATEMYHTGTRFKWTSNTPYSLKLVQHWIMHRSSADISRDESKEKEVAMKEWIRKYCNEKEETEDLE
jgi:hypothetical protein